MELANHRPTERHKSGEVPLVPPQIIYIMGPEGSGKSTQATILSDRTNLPVLSAGNVFRQLQQNESDLGQRARDLQNKGGYADGSLFHDAMEHHLSSSNHYKNGVIIEGAPRTADQVEILRKLVMQYIGENTPSHLIFLNMARLLAKDRLSGRPPRLDDDQLDTRLDSHYKDLAEKVKAMGAFADVNVISTVTRTEKGEIIGNRPIRDINEDIVDRLNIDRSKIRTFYEAGLSDGIREVADIDLNIVGHDVSTLPKDKRASAILAWIKNIDHAFGDGVNGDDSVDELTRLRSYLELKYAEIF